MILACYYKYIEVRKCELETQNAIHKVIRKGFDMKYDFSFVPLKKRKHVATSKFYCLCRREVICLRGCVSVCVCVCEECYSFF